MWVGASGDEDFGSYSGTSRDHPRLHVPVVLSVGVRTLSCRLPWTSVVIGSREKPSGEGGPSGPERTVNVSCPSEPGSGQPSGSGLLRERPGGTAGGTGTRPRTDFPPTRSGRRPGRWTLSRTSVCLRPVHKYTRDSGERCLLRLGSRTTTDGKYRVGDGRRDRNRGTRIANKDLPLGPWSSAGHRRTRLVRDTGRKTS